jgi:hypothetical protein
VTALNSFNNIGIRVNMSLALYVADKVMASFMSVGIWSRGIIRVVTVENEDDEIDKTKTVSASTRTSKANSSSNASRTK